MTVAKRLPRPFKKAVTGLKTMLQKSCFRPLTPVTGVRFPLGSLFNTSQVSVFWSIICKVQKNIIINMAAFGCLKVAFLNCPLWGSVWTLGAGFFVSENNMNKGGGMTSKQLKDRVLYWQERLNLMQWEICAQFAKPHVMRQNGYPQANGCNRHNEESLYAEIYICEENIELNGEDIEEVILHEVLHLHFAHYRISSGKLKEVLEELIIGCVSGALLNG